MGLNNTERFFHSVARFWRCCFGKFPRLIGSYCSYLLPKEALVTNAGKCNKILRLSGKNALYFRCFVSGWGHLDSRAKRGTTKLMETDVIVANKEVRKRR